MERGREGRRGGAGGGPVSAPRRPRTSGFKDATVGEDGDDILDDAHNQRLRERPSKKDSSSGPGGQGLNSNSIGSASRNKRKRQNSQEVQAQARSSTADEVDETTEDTEMGASEDDDDPPPPPIPRRMGKSRPQGKFLDDGISGDLPAVPRKARTAILKRPQESPSPPVVEAPPSHGPSVIPRTPAPSNAPSSSSVASLKPGRRTKPSSSKPRAAKLPKVSQPSISESEVEVAEALFDLALGIFQPPPVQEINAEVKSEPKPKIESKQDAEVKSEPKMSVSTSAAKSSPPRPPPPPPLPPPVAPAASATSAPSALSSPSVPSVSAAPTSSVSAATPPPAVTSTISASVSASPAAQATTPSPVLSPSPPPPAAAPPPAEAPKRKRPRIRTRPDETGSSSQTRALGSSAGSPAVPSISGPPPPSKSEPEQVSTSNSPVTEKSPTRSEACAPAPAGPPAAAVAAAAVVPPTAPAAPTQSVSSPPATVQRHNSLEKKAPAEKKITKVETSSVSGSSDKKSNAQFDRKAVPANMSSPPAAPPREADQTASAPAVNEPITKLELGKRSAQQANATSDGVRPIIDLMAPPVSKPTSTSANERTTEASAVSNKEITDKAHVEPPAPSEGTWMEREKERDKEREREREVQREKDRERERERDKERDRERDRERERERERDREREKDRQRENHRENAQRERENQKEIPRERDRKEEREKSEHGKQQPPVQRSGKMGKSESRVQKAERAASANATSAASSFLASAPPPGAAVAAGVSSAPLSVPGGVSGWAMGMTGAGVPGVGYYDSTAAAAATWPGAPVPGAPPGDETAPPVQLPHTYILQQQQQRQPLKRCARHVYIAHFIEMQQNIQRQSYLHATAYQNSASLFGPQLGTKSYNLNHPLPPSESLFGSGPVGPIAGGLSVAPGPSVVAGGGGNVPGLVGTVTERNLGPSTLAASAQSKERAYMESIGRKQSSQPAQQHQQPTQNVPSLSLQTGTTAAGSVAAATATVANGGPGANSGHGSGGTHMNVSSAAPTGSNMVVPGAGSGNGGAANHAAAAQAQYLQGFMQQGGFPFPFQGAPFGPPTFIGPPGHIGPQQAAQYFGTQYYPSHMVQHTPSHAQQQVQQPSGTSTVAGSALKQQHNSQQSVRSFPPNSPQHQHQQQQSSLAPPSQSPSHSQQQHPQGSNSQQVQRPADRDRNNAGDSSSTAESKFPMLPRGMYGQSNNNVTVSSVNSSASVVIGAGMQNLPNQDFTLINTMGSKQGNKQQQQQQHQAAGQLAAQQQSSLASQLQQQQQQQVVVQHHGSSPTLQMSLKGIDQPSSQTYSSMSMAAMNRGPGPIGLAPVAAVMAPQGHVMLQGMGTDPGRGHVPHHQSGVAQAHQHPLQQGQQQPRGVTMQRVGTGPPGEDRGGMADGGAFNNRNARDSGDEQKIPSKRGMSSSSALTRVDMETSSSMQGSPTGSGVQASRMAGNVGSTLNLMSPTSAIMASRSGQSAGGSSLQQSAPPPSGSQNSKQQVMPRGKIPPGGAPTATSAQSPLSFSDRNPMGAVLSSKATSQNLSLAGANVAPTSQGLRQGPVTQHPLKLSNRPSLGSMPTPSGTAPQEVLAAAIVKQRQQARPQGQVTPNPGPPSRLPPGNQGGQPTSSGMPLPPLPPVSKSTMSSASKSTSAGKGSFPLSHKPPGGAASKRSSPASGPPNVGLLGPSPPPAKPSPQQQGQGQHHLQQTSQQQQNVSQIHSQQTQPSQQSMQQSPQQPQALSTAQQQQQQYQQAQQAHMNSQQVQQAKLQHQQQQMHHQIRQQMYMQGPSYQQHQQPGSPMNPHPQQPSVMHQQSQQSSQQMHQQASPTSPQAQQQQQHSSPQLHQQQHMQGAPTSFSGHSSNGGLSLGPPTLTLGTGSNGNSSNSSRACSTDGMANSQGQAPRSHSGASKGGMSGSGMPMPNSNSQRSHGSGPSFMHGGQFNSGVPSGQQQSSSPRNGPGSPYVQTSSNTGGGGKSGEQKSASDASGQEQMNGMRMMSGSSPSRMPSGSLNLQSMPQRPNSGGSSAGKSLGGQFAGSNYGEGVGARSGLMLSVGSPTMASNNNSPGSHVMSNNGSANSSGPNSSPHMGSDGRPMFGSSSGSANQMSMASQGHGASPHQSSLSSPPGPTPNSQSGQSGMLGQTSSAVQP
ncbi:hypothetical protein MPTK1_4g11470 [Marchantia polymorpha subsp. ruderalis]|uniref:Uncharacterized protein n=2 Tax=Marchantia polymorpha TaxID=3197 RepID=A0AAF6B8U0_MARPO|nr:hypothetical protein MARPO_0011s0132 [Marchantia polymorpha]BBN08424.1 hypothetical protein Mp_4g11470 [Marchantia polymorpha subsp. ruderalis]|eukprot:PTQ46460.1 hypothetical protein MARPO_0011s0132 [Marchantia polymorpha]